MKGSIRVRKSTSKAIDAIRNSSVQVRWQSLSRCGAVYVLICCFVLLVMCCVVVVQVVTRQQFKDMAVAVQQRKVKSAPRPATAADHDDAE